MAVCPSVRLLRQVVGAAGGGRSGYFWLAVLANVVMSAGLPRNSGDVFRRARSTPRRFMLPRRECSQRKKRICDFWPSAAAGADVMRVRAAALIQRWVRTQRLPAVAIAFRGQHLDSDRGTIILKPPAGFARVGWRTLLVLYFVVGGLASIDRGQIPGQMYGAGVGVLRDHLLCLFYWCLHRASPRAYWRSARRTSG